ncbi:patatin-like phospholipase family protein [Ideonella alba]|uniref:Patatin-like phospholipase family protein n=1 Tax=Ideonella alba TaxID=2824118 RepID=A0A940Y911_9BURK|nr:patatin-like phospholipase family protein [Ideonella alba]MBQ0931093.1 patatin-like phospholipase family protein [Ideonella alba]
MARPTRRRPPRGPRIGLALAGGGPIGAIYEIGALCALEDSVEGLSFTGVDHFVGVSAGAFIAAALANGLTPRAMCAAFIENVGGDESVIDPGLFTQPAWNEYVRRMAMAPLVTASAAWQWMLGRGSLAGWMSDVGRLLPNGFFDNAPLERHLRQLFSAPGRSNDFRDLGQRLVVVATDLDTGDAAPFGQPGWDEVPISQAVIASAALPGLYPPVEIGGRHYVDGALKKTVHASVLLERGLDLLICLNPLVPFDATHDPGKGRHPTAGAIPRLEQGGLPALLSQTFRSLIHSRLELGMKGYERSHPDCDILLFEPDHGDAEMFHAGTFSYSMRRRLASHAFQQTRQMLRERAAELGPTLARHGLRLNEDRLHEPRQLLASDSPPAPRGKALVARTHRTLDRLERWVSRR